MSVADNLSRVRTRIADACDRAGRDPQGVHLVAVSKRVPVDAIREALQAGVTDIGENRAQDLRDKVPALEGEDVRWHFVGALQTNKVRYLDEVALVHGLDRDEEAAALEDRAALIDRSFDVLVEVNVAGEEQKQGVPPERVGSLLDGIARYGRVRPRGLMIVAPRAQNPEDVRWVFAEARRLRDRLREGADDRAGLEELSMGMSGDLEVAVEEGATIVRVGRAIFREE